MFMSIVTSFYKRDISIHFCSFNVFLSWCKNIFSLYPYLFSDFPVNNSRFTTLILTKKKRREPIKVEDKSVHV